MAGPLQRVLMRSAASAMHRAEASEWHYGPGFDPQKAAAQHPSLMTDHGAIILAMGKALRRAEPGLHEAAYRRMGVPVLGRIEHPGQVEGGDCVWLDARTLAVGRGVRTNQEGIQQLANLLSPKGIQVYGYDLPLWHGEEACLHLMSVISPLADDLALVYAPLLPAAFYQMLRARGIRLVEGDAQEFFASNGLSLNVLPT
ncbi:MAG: amidinotransferase, partial [Mesorhizobium sp.]